MLVAQEWVSTTLVYCVLSNPLGDLLNNQEILKGLGYVWVMICEEFVNVERNIIER
jgi:hypothetical protein